jgi:hypothetical protein
MQAALTHIVKAASARNSSPTSQGFLHCDVCIVTAELNPWSTVILQNLIVAHFNKKFSALTERKIPLQCLQQPAIGHYTEPDESNSHPRTTSIIKGEIGTTETSVNIYQTTRCNIPEDSCVHARRRENPKSYQFKDL